MAHGYMREYDEDYRGEDRERSEHDWNEDRYSRDRLPERGDRFMFGSEPLPSFSREGGRNRFPSHPDDHYRSWRDKQIQALDRDYTDYCREREQQFHSDFDSWRQQRGNPGPLRTGMTQTGLSMDPSGVTQAEAAANVGTTPPDPMDTATLGTTPEDPTIARRRR